MNTSLIDGNSLGHANHNGTVLTVGTSGFQTQAIFGCLKSIRAIKNKRSGWNTIILWDGEAVWRKEIIPDYKGNRIAATPEEAASKAAYKAQIPYLQKMLQMLGVRQVYHRWAEADDLAGVLSKRISARGDDVELTTGDKDWIQLVNSHVRWFDPIRDRAVIPSNFLEFTGYFSTAAFLDGKALMGDNSDNISGIGGIGETGAPLFLAEHGLVDNFFKKIDEGTYQPKVRKSKTAKSLHPEQYLASPEGRKKFYDNRKVMNLLDVPNPTKEDLVVIEPQFNKEGFRLLCERMAFNSILREFDGFVADFER